MRVSCCLAMAALLTGLGCNVSVIGSGPLSITGSGPLTRGSGVIKEEVREVPEFAGIELLGPFEGTVTVGPQRSVAIEADDNLIPLIATDVREGRLVVRLKEGHSIQATKPLKVAIVTPAVDSLQARGASKLDVTTAEGKGLKIDAEGASAISVKGLASDSVDVKVTGAGLVTLSGKAGRLTASVSGASRIFAGEAAVETAKVSLSGASQGELKVSEGVEGDLSGASKLRVRGGPKTRSVKTSGASSVSY